MKRVEFSVAKMRDAMARHVCEDHENECKRVHTFFHGSDVANCHHYRRFREQKAVLYKTQLDACEQFLNEQSEFLHSDTHRARLYLALRNFRKARNIPILSMGGYDLTSPDRQERALGFRRIRHTLGHRDAGYRFDPHESAAKEGEAGWTGIYSGTNVSGFKVGKDGMLTFRAQPFTDHMIRERVTTNGKCRALEPESQLEAMNMPREEVGMIKEGPALRYLYGQELLGKRFSRAFKTVAKHRRKNISSSSATP